MQYTYVKSDDSTNPSAHQTNTRGKINESGALPSRYLSIDEYKIVCKIQKRTLKLNVHVLW